MVQPSDTTVPPVPGTPSAKATTAGGAGAGTGPAEAERREQVPSAGEMEIAVLTIADLSGAVPHGAPTAGATADGANKSTTLAIRNLARFALVQKLVVFQ